MPPNVPPHLQQSILQQQQLQQHQLQQQQMMLNSHMQEPPGGMMGHPHPMDMRGYAPNGNNNFEEMQCHEWSDKDNAQWQEQFAQWSLNSQNQ